MEKIPRTFGDATVVTTVIKRGNKNSQLPDNLTNLRYVLTVFKISTHNLPHL